MEINKAKPFLKWAGGKTQLINKIQEYFPPNPDAEFSYIEPFIGSGAVLFWVISNYRNLVSATINDVNEDLINSYRTIKENVTELIQVLKSYEGEYHSLCNDIEEKKGYYYKKRDLFNSRMSDSTTQTAIFIFLNKTCFNGLYRVNRKNEYNVPIGSYKKPAICNEGNLLAVHSLLQNVNILLGDFERTADFANGNSILYLDPPYKPLSQTSSFNSYAKDGFDDHEQIRLKKFCDKLSIQQCQWILSNSDVNGGNLNNNFFDDLYSEYQISRVMAKRSINANPEKRGKLTELLITNQGVDNGI